MALSISRLIKVSQLPWLTHYPAILAYPLPSYSGFPTTQLAWPTQLPWPTHYPANLAYPLPRPNHYPATLAYPLPSYPGVTTTQLSWPTRYHATLAYQVRIFPVLDGRTSNLTLKPPSFTNNGSLSNSAGSLTLLSPSTIMEVML